MHLIYFFTAGPDEVRGWTIRKGSKAPQARLPPTNNNTFMHARTHARTHDGSPLTQQTLLAVSSSAPEQVVPLSTAENGVVFPTAATAQAAGAIHTDFERGFICAEVCHCGPVGHCRWAESTLGRDH